ncbi:MULTISPECIES: hypothetical protein [unclassified Bradyrhizobium]|uniref:hypothetical protein n=1 Tax=unclassified Bradyrhizobium TaxID=2631580 RepID=UPI001FFB2877|nr:MULTISPECIES: hypothetical protein [unclassified Bradyrhizobium]MCK1708029.1 hypothetical protein [Bradyrhizobium sp. 143]MCK1730282.1 hypothetical protein [Bradyrhizobium sp. 142]
MPDKIRVIELKTSLIAPCSDGGLVIAVAAIMPHARQRSKQKRGESIARFPQSGMAGSGELLPHRICAGGAQQ